jgi:hypothetical protein
MGVDLGDFDGDGRLDLVVANSELETNALYRNLGDGLFVDGRFAAGIAEPSLLMVGFGLAWADLDLDGDLDLVVANGHILDNPEHFAVRNRYAQPNQVFENGGGGRFREAGDAGLSVVLPSRGLAAADLDGDGDLDLAIVNSNERAEVYENVTGEAPPGHRRRFLALDLAGTASNRAGVGARVELHAGGRGQVREVKTASSYLSQNELTLRFGLGEAEGAERVTVRWPSGKVQRFAGLPAGRRVLLVEGPTAGSPDLRP